MARNVINEFYEDGVSYLELRSTPRANEANSMCKFICFQLMLVLVVTLYTCKNAQPVQGC